MMVLLPHEHSMLHNIFHHEHACPFRLQQLLLLLGQYPILQVLHHRILSLNQIFLCEHFPLLIISYPFYCRQGFLI